MKIGIDIRPLMEGKLTGVEIYTINLLKALFKLDRSNEYFLFSNSMKPFGPIKEFDFPNVKHKHFRFPNKLLNFSLRFLRLPKVDRLLGGLDIFFSPRYLFTALSRDCRSVVAIHDISFVINPNFFSVKRRFWHWLVSDRQAAKKAAKVVTDSHSTKCDLINRFDVPEEKIEVIHLGVEHHLYNQNIAEEQLEEVKNAYGLRNDYILYLGTIEPRKNIEGTIKAYEILRSERKEKISLVLAGGLGWSYRNILKKIDNSPYKSDIHFLGAVPESSKPALYRSAKMLVFPSFYEGFGLPPLEAAACGTPVIAGMNSSFPEVMGDACVYVNPYDSVQIATAMKALLNDEALRSKMIQAGLERVKIFSWENTARGLLKIFQSLGK